MIGAQRERTQTGGEAGFLDSVSIDFCDLERELFGLVRLTRRPNEERARAIALLFFRRELVGQRMLEAARVPASWERAELDGVSLSITAPLERWNLSFIGAEAGIELEGRALSPPLELDEGASAPVGRAAGVSGYEQLCELNGAAHVGGRNLPLTCIGRRSHTWGARDWKRIERWRSLYAASEPSRAVAVAAALPVGSRGHGEELRTAHLVADGQEPMPFEEVRVSTVFGRDGLPTKVGLELYVPGEELPQRATGEVVCGASLEEEGEWLRISFLNWSVDGTPALGCYEILSPR